MSPRRSAPGRRLVAVLAVAGGAFGLFAASQVGHPYRPSLPPAPSATAGPVLAPGSAIASTWFCAEGTAVTNGRAAETVLIANVAPRTVTATVTVMTGSAKPLTRRLSVAAFGQRRVPVSTLATAPEPGVVVEVPGSGGVVEHELSRGSQDTIGPCARQATTDWYFSGGNTGVGAEDWLALFNPFGDDAIVDVTFLTSTGVESPGSAQAVVVPRRSRVSLPLHVIVPDHEALAFHVHARLGRLVAEQSIATDGSNGPAGLTTMLGVAAPATTWRIPALDAQSGTAATLSIANFANAGTKTTLNFALDQHATLPVNRFTVPSMDVTANPVGQNVPPSGGWALTVRGPRAGPILPAVTETWAAPAAVAGMSATVGATASARRWVFTTGRLDTADPAQVVALNTTGRRLHVTLLTAGSDAAALHPVSTTAVGAHRRAVFPLDATIGPDQVLVLQATGPVVGGRLVLGPSVITGTGVPDLG